MSTVIARPASKWWKYLLFLVLAGLILCGAAAWYMSTDSFQAFVRSRIVSAIEKATGGRVELGTYHTIPFRLQVEIRDLTVHGLEPAGEVPLAHIDRAVARIKVISLLETSFGFKFIALDHPVVHLIVNPDGTTNLPQAKVARSSGKTPIEQLFALSISRLRVRRGEFLWNDKVLPFDFDVEDVSADMTYSFFRRRYESNLVIGKVKTKFQDGQLFAWMAAARFSLGTNEVEVSSLKWDSGRSHLEARGHVSDFRDPKIQLTYVGTLDLAEAAAIVRRPELRSGICDISGKGVWRDGKFSADGQASLKSLDWRDGQISVHDASLSSDFAIDDRRLKFTKAQARLFGGSVTADAEITNWLPAQATPVTNLRERGKKPEEQKGIVRVRFKDIAAGAVVAALGNRGNGLDQLNVAGTADGSIDTHWTGLLSRADTDFALNFVPPLHPQPREIPITATARGTYQGASEELQLTQFDANTRATQLHARGGLAATSSLQFSVSTTDLEELRPIIVVLDGPAHLPVTLKGRARVNGVATGKLSSPSLAGHVEAEDFDVLLPAIDHTPERPVHWDSASADVRFSQREVTIRHATAEHADTSLGFEVSAVLSQGQFAPDDPFNVNLKVENADVAELLALAGYDYPVSGRMNLSAQASGTREHPHADGHAHLADAVVYGQPIQRLDSDLRWYDGEASLNNIELAYYDATLTGGADYTPASGRYQFNLSGKNLDLARVPSLQVSRIPIEGAVDFSAQGAGTPDSPVVNAKVVIRDLTLDHERAGNLHLDAVTERDVIRLTARSEFEHAQLNLDGTVQPRGDYPADLSLRLDHLDLDAFFRKYLNARTAGHTGVTGEVQLRGALREPLDMTAVANLSVLDADIDNVKLGNQGPIRFTIAHKVARLEQLHILGQDTDFSAHGTAGLAGSHELDLAADGHLNLQLIQTLNSSFTSSGTVDLAMTVAGPAKDPILEGKLIVTHGSVAYIDLPSGLSDMNGSLVFNKNRLEIENLVAHSGGGTITLAGQVSSYAGQINFDFTAHSLDVRLRYPAGVSSTATTDLHFFGTRESSTLAGDVTITKLAITPGFDFAAYASSSSQSVVVPPASSWLYRVKLDVHVTTAPDLQMQTAMARLSGTADLHVKGNAAKPAVLGRVEVLEGEINFNGAKYRLERGDVAFSSPVGIKPVLDLQAITRVRDYDITVSISGDPSKPLSVKYRSDPPLPEADIVALLAVGQTREQSAQFQQTTGNSAFSQTASNLILSEALNATVSNRVQKLFGVSKMKIDPQGLNTETNPTRGPQVTIEQQFSNMFTLTYSQNVSQASQQIIQGEYYVRKNISIVGTRDQNGVVSFDLNIRQRKK